VIGIYNILFHCTTFDLDPDFGYSSVYDQFLVCLVATSHKNYSPGVHENFTRDVSLDGKNLLNSGSHPRLDPDLGIFCKFLDILARISRKTDEIFMKVLSESEMYVWTRVRINFWKSSGYRPDLPSQRSH